MRIAASLVVLFLAAAPPAWALLPCPAAARDVTLAGSVVGWFYGGVPQPHYVQMHPCEEFWLDLQASSTDPNVNTASYVDVFNSAGTKIGTRHFGLAWHANTSISAPNSCRRQVSASPSQGRATRAALFRVLRFGVTMLDQGCWPYPIHSRFIFVPDLATT